MCHHGVRSAQVAAFLLNQGWTRVFSVAGGIDRWSVDVDPKVPRYADDSGVACQADSPIGDLCLAPDAAIGVTGRRRAPSRGRRGR